MKKTKIIAFMVVVLLIFSARYLTGCNQTQPSLPGKPTSTLTPTSQAWHDPTHWITPLPSPTAEAVAPWPVGQPADTGWILKFSDEFDEDILDLEKWRPNWLGPSDTAVTKYINTLEKNCYNPANVSVNNGTLRLTANPISIADCETRNESISSGIVQSDNHFLFIYGYVEASIKMPAGKGLWPAFWTNGTGDWPSTGEIDIVECYGTDESCYPTYHWMDGNTNLERPSTVIPGSTEDFHIYAALWEPEQITWFYDGKEIFRWTTGISDADHYLILNLAIRDENVPLPSVMEVDYVRVWQR